MQRYFENFIDNISRHEIFVMAAALAYATALALAPFILIILSLVSLLNADIQYNLAHELTALFGGEVGDAVRAILQNTDQHPKLSGLSGLIGFVILALSASATFSQLRIALDKINEYQVPENNTDFWSFLKSKFLSLGLVLGFAFLSIVSLLVTAFLAVIYPDNGGEIWHVISFSVNFLLFTLLFTAIYRFIPSDRLSWRRCFLSGVVSTFFYLIGKSLIGMYLGRAGLGSPYGAAGSLIVFLAWVYYTAVTLLISYEISTHLIFSKRERLVYQ